MLALSIRQPYAEMILRGEKTIEYRSRPTTRIGERFYIYAARKTGIEASPGRHPGIEAAAHKALDPLMPWSLDALPKGVIVGTAKITACTRNHAGYEWHLSDVQRMKKPRKPKRQPQPVWFRPF